MYGRRPPAERSLDKLIHRAPFVQVDSISLGTAVAGLNRGPGHQVFCPWSPAATRSRGPRRQLLNDHPKVAARLDPPVWPEGRSLG